MSKRVKFANSGYVLDITSVASNVGTAGQVTTVAKASLVDDETLVIVDPEGTTRTFYFQVTGAAAGPGVEVDVQTDTTAEDVRDRLVSVINSLPTGTFKVTAVAGGATDQLLLYPTVEGNLTLTETVANAGFVVLGLQISQAITFRTEHFGLTVHVISDADGDLELMEYMGPLDVGVSGAMADTDFKIFEPAIPIAHVPKKQIYSDKKFPPMVVKFTPTGGADPYYLKVRVACNGA